MADTDLAAASQIVQPRQVGSRRFPLSCLALQVGKHTPRQGSFGTPQGIVNPRAVPAVRNEVGAAKHRQMSGDLALRHFQDIDKLTDAQFTLGEQDEQSLYGSRRHRP